MKRILMLSLAMFFLAGVVVSVVSGATIQLDSRDDWQPLPYELPHAYLHIERGESEPSMQIMLRSRNATEKRTVLTCEAGDICEFIEFSEEGVRKIALRKKDRELGGVAIVILELNEDASMRAGSVSVPVEAKGHASAREVTSADLSTPAQKRHDAILLRCPEGDTSMTVETIPEQQHSYFCPRHDLQLEPMGGASGLRLRSATTQNR